MKRSLPIFTEEQAHSAIKMLELLCAPGATSLELKSEWVEKVRGQLLAQFAPKSMWS